jgi:carbon storage regulator
MLVLTRKIHETIVIGGTIRITTISIRGRHVRLAIEAPNEVHVVREELLKSPRGVAAKSERFPLGLRSPNGACSNKRPL